MVRIEAGLRRFSHRLRSADRRFGIGLCAALVFLVLVIGCGGSPSEAAPPAASPASTQAPATRTKSPEPSPTVVAQQTARITPTPQVTPTASITSPPSTPAPTPEPTSAPTPEPTPVPASAVDVLAGTIEVQRGGDGQWLSAKSGTLMWPGDAIRTNGNGQAGLSFADGSEVVLQGSTTLMLDRFFLRTQDNMVLERFGRMVLFAGSLVFDG